MMSTMAIDDDDGGVVGIVVTIGNVRRVQGRPG
jgi:hypothetical protein